MATILGGFTFPNLNAQPFGYDGTSIEAGRTARKWTLSGFLKPSEWASLVSVYNTWRNARINDPDSITSNSVGTTISLSTTGAGQSWSNIACWFIATPTGTQSGKYILATVEVVDANQKLAVLLKEQEATGTTTEDVNLGTFTINGAVLTLKKPPDTYVDTPTLELTATGNHVIKGANVVVRVKDIEGTTDANGWALVRAWYEGTVASSPAPGNYFPLTAPSATAENKVINGVTTIIYRVTMQLGVVV